MMVLVVASGSGLLPADLATSGTHPAANVTQATLRHICPGQRCAAKKLSAAALSQHTPVRPVLGRMLLAWQNAANSADVY
jgi:hypothetical protein